jgi:hypothetical protein
VDKCVVCEERVYGYDSICKRRVCVCVVLRLEFGYHLGDPKLLKLLSIFFSAISTLSINSTL